MARRTPTTWVAAVAAAILVACGSAAEEPPFEANPPEPGQEAPTEDPEALEPDDPGDEPREPGRTPEGEEGGPPWHLLPEDDRPEPVEQPRCEPASVRPAAC
jgi:hypothetical protein